MRAKTPKIHPSITLDAVMDAVLRNENDGFCLSCGSDEHTCEPDARGYHCSDCGEDAVYGAEEVLFMLS